MVQLCDVAVKTRPFSATTDIVQPHCAPPSAFAHSSVTQGRAGITPLALMLTTIECQVQVKKQLLSFVVVGGGPTGVEVAAELQDMVESDLVKVYPDLIQDVRIAVIELQDHVLSTYDRRISEYTKQIFTR